MIQTTRHKQGFKVFKEVNLTLFGVLITKTIMCVGKLMPSKFKPEFAFVPSKLLVGMDEDLTLELQQELQTLNEQK